MWRNILCRAILPMVVIMALTMANVVHAYQHPDVNRDGAVDVLDMVSIGQHWNEVGQAGWIPEDVNEDGTIDVLDNILIGQHWTSNDNQPPVLDLIGDKTVNTGELLEFTISATDPDGGNLSYSASNLPPEASFNPETRTFSWTPVEAGSYLNVHFEVSDGSLTDSENITVTVNQSTLSYGTQFFHLRFELSTTSDWVTLSNANPESILGSRVIAESGVAVNTDTSRIDTGQFALTQPIVNAQAEQNVSITVDYAMSASIQSNPPHFALDKGNLNQANLRVYVVTENQLTLIHEGQLDGNTLHFALNSTELTGISPILLQESSAQKLLLAFYYPWYDADSWQIHNWSDAPLSQTASTSPETMTRVITQAQSVGIDAFISSWNGPQTPSDRIFADMLDTAQALDFKMGIYLETLSNEGTLTQADIENWLNYALTNYGSHPAMLRENGKPVIFIWASSYLSLDQWSSIFANLHSIGRDAFFIGAGSDESNLTVFDGNHHYGVPIGADVYENARKASWTVNSYEMIAESTSPRLWVAPANPGFDDPARPSLLHDRDNGNLYRSTLDAAIESMPDWIVICSWNEWPEGTAIEPSEKYGDQYLQITREYADRWKNGG